MSGGREARIVLNVLLSHDTQQSGCSLGTQSCQSSLKGSLNPAHPSELTCLIVGQPGLWGIDQVHL